MHRNALASLARPSDEVVGSEGRPVRGGHGPTKLMIQYTVRSSETVSPHPTRLAP